MTRKQGLAALLLVLSLAGLQLHGSTPSNRNHDLWPRKKKRYRLPHQLSSLFPSVGQKYTNKYIVDNNHVNKGRIHSPEQLQTQVSSESLIPLHHRGGSGGTTTGSSSSSLLPPGFTIENVSGAIAFILLNKMFTKIFQACHIKFPAQLGGCMILFAVMSLIPSLGRIIFEALNPGAELMAKWIGVCFIGGAVMLPTAPSIPVLELLKVVFLVILGGTFATCFSTAVVVWGIRTLLGSIQKDPAISNASNDQPKSMRSTAPPPPPPVPLISPFSTELLQLLLPASIITGGLMLGVQKFSNNEQQLLPAINSIFLTLSTVAAFVWSIRLPASFNKKVHPIFTSTAIVWMILQVIAIMTGQSFFDVVATYKTESTGAGDILLGLLGPTVVSFSMAVYNRRELLWENLLVVVSGALISSFGTLFGTAALVRLVSLGGKGGGSLLRLSTLARNVVPPLAVVICTEIGGNTSIQLAIVVATGILGATFARSWMDAAKVQDPVARGMGVGGCGLSLAAATMAPETEAFPFAILAFVLNAVFATIIVTIPALKEALIQLATGA